MCVSLQINSYKYHQYQFHHHPHHSIVHHTKTNTTAKMKANLNAPMKCAIGIEQPNEKYSLRQRQKRSTRNTNKQTEDSTKNDQSEASNDDSATAAAAAAATAADPSTITPSSSERSTQQTKSNKKSAAKSKAKQKAAPLSKYRRKTANARERIRMREINSAFEHLRECVPTSFCESTPQNSNEKLTKITTLRMAMKYISTLTNILNSSDTSDETNALVTSIISKSTNQLPPMGNAFINNNNDSMTINNNNNNKNMKAIEMETKVRATATTPPNNKGKQKGKSKKATNATANKAISKRKSTKSKAATKSTNNKTINIENNLAIKSQIYESIPNTINTLCLTPPLSSTDSPIDLGLMLESDGESLHLSEPCLSPSLSSTSTTPSNQKQFISTTVTPPASMTMSNGLDIGLFLDSDTDSLHFPEPCLSPLDGGFDVFSPFSDLLNPGFPEHSSLDIYLT